MIGAWERRLLRVMRVPPEPQPPSGSPGSLRVFRAGKNYLRLRLIVWLGAQVGAVFGVLVSLAFIQEVELQNELKRVRAERAAALADAAKAAAEPAAQAAAPAAPEPEFTRGRLHQLLYSIAPRGVREAAAHMPERALFWMKVGEAFGLAGFVVQFFGSLGVALVDFRQRWYMVTDRSLRLRWGIWNVHESTMSFANLQQVAVHQGPLGRVLGLWDVEVESAGGGAGSDEEKHKDSLHRCVFHGVENGAEIRDIILARLRQFREAGLGDPDDQHAQIASGTTTEPSDAAPAADAVQAAREVLAELRGLRELLRD